MKKGKKKPSFRTKLIFLTLSACIISTFDSWNRTDGVVRFSFFETGSF